MPRALDVLLPLPLAPLRWLAPYGSDARGVGRRVVVPWQRGVRVGIVVGESEVGDAQALELREAIQDLHDGPPLPDATVAWLLAEAERTLAPPGVVLAGLHHPGLTADLDHRVRLLDPAGGPAGAWRAASDVPAADLDERREQGLLEEAVAPVVPTRRVLHPVDDPPADAEAALTTKQRTALDALRAAGRVDSGAALARAAGVGDAVVRALVRRGVAAYGEAPVAPDPPAAPAPAPWPDDAALGRDAHGGAATDLRAVGGGTFAARLAAVLPTLRADLAAGRSPLVLAPERRAAEDAAAWLANDVPVLAGPPGGDAPRRRAWDAVVADGTPRVLVGTYALLAAPVAAPARLVLLDAEAESYKLRSGARPWIPHAARAWADAHAVPLTVADVVLGPEATALVPGAGDRTRTLPRPRVRWALADLAGSRTWPLGTDAIRVLKQVRDRDRQALVLVPRRGYSAALGCRDCGAAVMCPNCDLALRWHARDARLRCHQCGHEAAPPAACPSCGGPDLEAQRAAGSEWVLRAIAEMVPDLPRYRYDGDVRDDLAPLHAGAPGVVVGTTALLRLPPLPVVSLLLVTQVDGALHADDFRAELRVLRLLAAFAGAAGTRAPLGVLQTFAPDHPVLRAVAGRDGAGGGADGRAGAGEGEAWHALLADVDARRARFGYPPHGRMARLQASARREGDAWAALGDVVARLETAGASGDEILGPAPAPVPRVRGRSIVHLLLRTTDTDRRNALLRAATTDTPRGVTLRVDVDPRDVGEVLE